MTKNTRQFLFAGYTFEQEQQLKEARESHSPRLDRNLLSEILEYNQNLKLKCRSCNEIKSIKEFDIERLMADCGNKFRCSECIKFSSANEPERKNKSKRKIHACLRDVCPQSDRFSSVELECSVCGRIFKREIHVYNRGVAKGTGYICCSNACRFIALTKKWQQNNSGYAKKIKQLLKQEKQSKKAHDLTHLQAKSDLCEPVKVPQYERD